MSHEIKQKIAACFNAASATYDAAAHLQKLAGDYLLKQLPGLNIAPAMIADIGAGTGKFINPLKNQYETAAILAVDIAETMLLKARQQNDQAFNYICADFDCLPFADEALDLIYSNLTLQWSLNLEKTLFELNRILKNNSYLLFSTLGATTLKELRQCRRRVDKNLQTNNFLSTDTLVKTLKAQNFIPHHVHCTVVIQNYMTVIEIMRSLKVIGAHYAFTKNKSGLNSKMMLERITYYYENYRQPDLQLPVTYEIIYIIAEKTAKAK